MLQAISTDLLLLSRAPYVSLEVSRPADLQVDACRCPLEEFCGALARQIDWRNLLTKKTLRLVSEGFKLGAGVGFEPTTFRL